MSNGCLLRAHIALNFVLLLVLLVSTTHLLPAQTLTILHAFAGYPTDGENPMGLMTIDAEGNLFGTTYIGGAYSCPGGGWGGCGTVFEVTPKGQEIVLHSFGRTPTATLLSDGASPSESLVLDSNGQLFGTTCRGGSSRRTHAPGYGTVFELPTSGASHYATLYNFTQESDGECPNSAMLDAQGNIIATTYAGGAYGAGTVFALTPAGKRTILYSFAGYPTDGANPRGALIEDPQGNFYGVTYSGGAFYCPVPGSDCGAVFKLSPDGEETVLHNFTGYPNDGGVPNGPLALDEQGNLYGTTIYGGAVNYGAVYKLSPDGTETLLHSFTLGPDGGNPLAGLVLYKGNLYGTTGWGGNDCESHVSTCGVIFSMTLGGSETVRYRFTGEGDGGHPFSGIVFDSQGNLYGTTFTDGSDCHGPNGGCGTVFKLAR